MKKHISFIFILLTLFFLTACGHEHEFTEATCTTPPTCSICGKTEGEALGHSYSEATCTNPPTCIRCSATEGEALGHKLSEATCTEPATCTVCGHKEGKKLGHSYVAATCTTSSYCTVCNKEKYAALGHSFNDPTCTAPSTCVACGETEGEPLGHDMLPATCTDPIHCSRCDVTEGQALGHTVVDATCTTGSYCSVCEEVFSEPLGHKPGTFSDCKKGIKCTVCNAYTTKPTDHKYVAATCTTLKTCSVCGYQTGNLANHAYVITNSYSDGSYNYTVHTCSNCGASYTDSVKIYNDNDVYNVLMSFQSSYPEGTFYDNSVYYGWKGGIYSGGYGCAGFAFMLSDAAFGSSPAKMVYSTEGLRVGDILRTNNDTHMVIILAINGDSVTVAEGNYNGSVHWGRTLSLSNCGFTYALTRY